ncbi:phosphoglycerate dehydrogenase [Desulfurivibrio alkaliphilus]|uniref:D-3-phosphoglycerate dehydrogenase n=1 Tax=Desulfurivibrio alkaliphilus (strain DSM 19089 / UNIQEM U267 / AHT2) TaxID=589865 RepID=D6Z148_DESAT|nr:phosphoglycerate dehydrogenase [Desulfurivibrio alkaliphilus]ADH85303.1 D-3-phosphoglycerate dehydrogenase [Desulfurivibrio alkaliphilus AHT 2]
MKVLISDNLASVGETILREAGLEVDVRTGLSPEELRAIIADYDGLVIRSATKVTAEIIEAADNLKVVGRAGIGLDNVDVAAASQKGIVVMNAPDGNATTAAEHAVAMMMALTRNVPQATASMKEGKWEKKKFQGREVTGKTMGVVGIGRIGRIFAERAMGLRMKVIAFDPHMPKEQVEKLGAELVSLDELCRRADYISVHVPLTPETKHVLGAEQFALMKPEAMLIDCARGGVVEEKALYEALKNGTIRGAALDVFEVEPTTKENCPLLGLDNFICTPHLGASTAEAQENVAVAIAEQMSNYLLHGTVVNAVNVPSVSADVMAKVGPYVKLAEMIGALHMQIAKGGVEEVVVEFSGDLAQQTTTPITVALLKGLFTPILREAVNYVNAPLIAKERGIRVVESKTGQSDDFLNLMSVRVKTSEGENVLAGTVFGKKEPRLVRFNTFRLEALPEGPMLFVHNNDVPGVIGKLASTIGDAGVNIARMTVGREQDSGRNIILLNTDSLLDRELLKKVKALDNIHDAMVLDLP